MNKGLLPMEDKDSRPFLATQADLDCTVVVHQNVVIPLQPAPTSMEPHNRRTIAMHSDYSPPGSCSRSTRPQGLNATISIGRGLLAPKPKMQWLCCNCVDGRLVG